MFVSADELARVPFPAREPSSPPSTEGLLLTLVSVAADSGLRRSSANDFLGAGCLPDSEPVAAAEAGSSTE